MPTENEIDAFLQEFRQFCDSLEAAHERQLAERPTTREVPAVVEPSDDVPLHEPEYIPEWATLRGILGRLALTLGSPLPYLRCDGHTEYSPYRAIRLMGEGPVERDGGRLAGFDLHIGAKIDINNPVARVHYLHVRYQGIVRPEVRFERAEITPVEPRYVASLYRLEPASEEIVHQLRSLARDLALLTF